MVPIPGLPYATCDGPVSINDSGEVAGTWDDCADETPTSFLFAGGKLTTLKVWPNTGYELNDKGDVAGTTVVGTAGGSSAASAIELANGTVENLNSVTAGDSVTVQALNNQDEAVGTEGTATGSIGVAWINGTATPVTSLLSTPFSGTLDSAVDVNQEGTILAFGTPTGTNTEHAYLLEANGQQVSGKVYGTQSSDTSCTPPGGIGGFTCW